MKTAYVWIHKFVSSRRFFILTLAFFLLQGIFFSAAIAKFIPADEAVHFGAVSYYADQPLSSGFGIDNQSDESLYLGDLERNVNYLYYYLLSLPLKIFSLFTQNENVQLFLLRAINVFIGLGVLLVTHKIALLTSRSKFVSNLTVFLLTSTGMFVWISAAVNYDMFAILFFSLAIFSLLRSILQKQNHQLVRAGVYSMGAVLVKITFAPILLIALAFTAAYVLRRDGYRKIVGDNRKYFSRLRPAPLITIAAGLILLTLIIERPILNYVNYGAISPGCDKVHSVDSCMNNFVYRRDAIQRQGFDEQKAAGLKVEYKPFEFTGLWLEQMYERLYFYFGHKVLPSEQIDRMLFLMMTVAVVLSAFLLKKRRLPIEHAFLGMISLSYIFILYSYNLMSFLNTNSLFGYQGRYLLPVVGFSYILALLSMRVIFRNKDKLSKALQTTILLVFAVLIIRLQPLFIFHTQANPNWYSKPYQAAINKYKEVF